MKKRSYPSQSILGILYRRALEFKNKHPDLFEDIDDPTNSFTKVRVTSTFNLREIIFVSFSPMKRIFGST
jgi:hypothetical protein